MTNLSACAKELAPTKGLGIWGHRELEHIEEHMGDFLGAAERELAASLLLS